MATWRAQAISPVFSKVRIIKRVPENGGAYPWGGNAVVWLGVELFEAPVLSSPNQFPRRQRGWCAFRRAYPFAQLHAGRKGLRICGVHSPISCDFDPFAKSNPSSWESAMSHRRSRLSRSSSEQFPTMENQKEPAFSYRNHCKMPIPTREHN